MATALEAKQMRKARNKLKRQLSGDALAQEVKALRQGLKRSRSKFSTLDSMNKTIDAGGVEAVNASKAKRKMNDNWKRPVSVNLFEMWNPEGKHYAR